MKDKMNSGNMPKNMNNKSHYEEVMANKGKVMSPPKSGSKPGSKPKPPGY